jgi:hypothetical protein
MLDFTTDAAKIVADFAPASLTTRAAPTVSSRYSFINSAKALDILASYGFHPTAAQQQRSRDKSKAPYAAHMLRFQNEAYRTSEGIPELLLLNSHNRRTSLGLGQGFFRYACSNNVVLATSGIFQRLRHNAATEAAFENLVIEKAAGLPETMARIERLQNGSIDACKARYMVGAMCDARGWKFRHYDAQSGTIYTSPGAAKNQTYFTGSTLDDLLTSRRDADNRSTVWNIFNRVQECFCSANNGFKPVRVVSTSTKYPEGRLRIARSIRSIAGNTALNAKLFDIAEGALEHA